MCKICTLPKLKVAGFLSKLTIAGLLPIAVIDEKAALDPERSLRTQK